MGRAENDSQGQAQFAQFKERLGALGWSEGVNLSIDVRWMAGDAKRVEAIARELVSLQPSVILSTTTPPTAALQRETSTIPIVFVSVSDPVGSGFVKTLSHPGGNITGVVQEARLMEKWLELLREVAPHVSRVAVIFHPDSAPYAEHYLRTLSAAAPKQGSAVLATPVRNEADIQATISGLSRDSGLLVMPDIFMAVQRKLIIALAARYKVPAMYYQSDFVRDGGLVSYGSHTLDLFRRSAIYVDRILRGAKPADLPVEHPVKYEWLVNLKTATALGLTIPQAMLLRADEVIQ